MGREVSQSPGSVAVSPSATSASPCTQSDRVEVQATITPETLESAAAGPTDRRRDMERAAGVAANLLSHLVEMELGG
ncbi:hypothetical protein ACIBI3_07275 [Actinomadura luteofluorescens]|uniref:hypothetical protein n=1 Tax=Actinomadura luteofluorescens TaxID=46163 RepID=UPI003483B8EF